MTSKYDKAHWLAFLLPAALLGGAYGSQYIGGLFPCEMCWWQRYPHFAAVAIAAIAFGVGNRAFRKTLVALAALAIATSGGIAGFHAGVEYGWWEGLTACTARSARRTGAAADPTLTTRTAMYWALFNSV